MASRVSSISQALAGTSSAMDIPKPRAEPVFARGMPSASATGASSFANIKHGSGLPTPPNSISPNLPPHSLKARSNRELAQSPPAIIESDIDLQEAVEHANRHSAHRRVPLGVKSASYGDSHAHGNITPQYLAKYHLPEILDGSGPVAVKDIMDHLSKSVPGYADITAAKARRIVVAALESRTGGGVHGEIEFDKVGWGKWDARPRGSGRVDKRSVYTIPESHVSPPASVAGSYGANRGLRIPSSSKYMTARRRRQSRGSSAQDTIYSRSEIMPSGAVEHDVDAMSIDEDEEDEVPVRFHAPRINDSSPQEQEGSDTDEEDWATIGAAGLRSRSYGSTGGILPMQMNRSRTRTPSTPFAHSVPIQRVPEFKPLDFTGVEADSQEREAIEALLRMGAM